MTTDEKRLLKTVFDLVQSIENQFYDKVFLQTNLEKLLQFLEMFSASSDLSLQKLSLISGHLHPEMELRHFLNFVIPIERALGRNLSDDQFLVTREDRSSSVDAVPISRVPLVFVLENLRSAFNVGSIFRLADCLSIREIHLVGYTMTPDQSSSSSLLKTSLGSTDVVPWKTWVNLSSSLENLRGQGFEIVALETAAKSQGLYDFHFHRPTALVVGNERFGLEASSLKLCDQVISIPTWGIKNSLNVSQALAIGAYEWRRQWK